MLIYEIFLEKTCVLSRLFQMIHMMQNGTRGRSMTLPSNEAIISN